MPAVEILPPGGGAPVRADAPGGGRLVDVCDETRAPVLFSCRSASCGTCLVEVIEGAELLDPPSSAEREVLDLFGETPHDRLACQASLRPGPGLVRLRAARVA